MGIEIPGHLGRAAVGVGEEPLGQNEPVALGYNRDPHRLASQVPEDIARGTSAARSSMTDVPDTSQRPCGR